MPLDGPLRWCRLRVPSAGVQAEGSPLHGAEYCGELQSTVEPSQRMVVSSCGSLDVLEGAWPQVCGSAWEMLVVMLGRGVASLLELTGQLMLRMGTAKALGAACVWSDPGACWKLSGTDKAYSASL